ncbi:2-hydroxy-acid oxidase, partial [Candidatus Bathyarchaeota archaeon B24-2]
MKYNKVTEDVLNELKEIIGEENVLTNMEDLEKYSHDETAIGVKALPEVVVKPEDTDQVSKILALANERKIPVTPRGQGTGLCNGAVPIYGGILLSLERMNRILEIDEDNLMAVVEAGVVLSDLRAEVEKRGLFYPADPGERTSAIGGNINTNAGGMNGVKYGKTRNYILGLEAVLPSGKVLNLGGKVVKRSTGYDLMQLIIGSEGTLAVVTKAILKLVKLPKMFMTLYVPFNNLYDAARSVSDILRERITPTAIEFVERDVILEAEKKVGKTMPHHDSEAYLIIRIEGDKEEELYEHAEGISEICMRNNAVDVLVADTKERQDRIWDTRSIFYEAIVKSEVVELVDAAVPPSKIPEYVEKVKELSRKYGIRILSYGHAGDGNIHVHPIKGDLSDEEWSEKLPKLMEDLYREARALGGVVSGEHGIGWTKKRYLPICLDEEE